jgi:hypothetical protein
MDEQFFLRRHWRFRVPSGLIVPSTQPSRLSIARRVMAKSNVQHVFGRSVYPADSAEKPTFRASDIGGAGGTPRTHKEPQATCSCQVLLSSSSLIVWTAEKNGFFVAQI